MSKIGRENITKTMRNIMSECIGHDLAKLYTWTGQKKTLAFKGSEMSNAIIDLMNNKDRKHSPNASNVGRASHATKGTNAVERRFFYLCETDEFLLDPKSKSLLDGMYTHVNMQIFIICVMKALISVGTYYMHF
ncbi:uncharacterized protein LOC120359600 [Solenopsis invicta]|uniref:uncharacterized protein LOC120359600 n=1 Tax=Solenopsis invicta TaxID=13686 RepID=UPI00193D8841|nr:uncharacterized protein LOC120359600 [Solenopsis invicta]